MARLRYNGLKGALGGSLTNSATSVTFGAALSHSNGTAVPTIVSPDYIPLTVLDSSGNLSEVVYLTAYTSGATTGTISRGKDGTTGVSHASGDKFVEAPGVTDVPVTRFKTAAETVTNLATPQDDDHLSFPIGANEVWVITYYLFASAASATPDLLFQPSIPSGATARWGIHAAGTATSNTETVLKHQSHASAALSAGASSTSDTAIIFWACVEAGATPGTVVLQWAQAVANASGVTLERGSFLVAHRVA